MRCDGRVASVVKCGWKAASGQSTVEYALVAAAFSAFLAGMGALGHVVGVGSLVSHALASAPHHLAGVFSGAVVNLFLV